MVLLVSALLGLGAIPIMVTAIKASNAAGSFFSGTIADRYGKLFPAITLIVMALVGIILFIATRDALILIVASLLLGFSMAATYPVVLAWLREKVDPQEYLAALGIFHVYNNMGTVAAITANLWIPAATSFIPGALALAIALPCILLFNKLPKRGV
jgi:MFS family permease